jgi:hypothetical protein
MPKSPPPPPPTPPPIPPFPDSRDETNGVDTGACSSFSAMSDPHGMKCASCGYGRGSH